MAIKMAVATRNARLNAIETDIGTSAILKIRTGAPPASATTADSGTILVSMNLPSSYFAAAAAGAMTLSGTWSGTSVASGTAGHFRLYTSATGSKLQGTVTASGGGGDMEINAAGANIGNGQTVTVTAFTLTDGNA